VRERDGGWGKGGRGDVSCVCDGWLAVARPQLKLCISKADPGKVCGMNTGD
jgi:hypothetical protein